MGDRLGNVGGMVGDRGGCVVGHVGEAGGEACADRLVGREGGGGGNNLGNWVVGGKRGKTLLVVVGNEGSVGD